MPDAVVIVNFGEPTHGWLPVTFRAGTFCLKVDASYVPINPLDSLSEALAVAPAGGHGRVVWFLEPAEYWFDFENQAGKITLTITEKPGRAQATRQLWQLTGTPADLLYPFYQALQEFSTRSYAEAHWPRVDKRRLAQVGQLLKNQP